MNDLDNNKITVIENIINLSKNQESSFEIDNDNE
jgi:hypothetical protein